MCWHRSQVNKVPSETLPMDQVRERLSTGLGNMEVTVTMTSSFKSEWDKTLMGTRDDEGSKGSGDMNGSFRNLAVRGSKK